MILKKKFREYAYNLRSNDDEQNLKQKFLSETYQILCKFLGCPPDSFDWEFMDKNKKYHKVKNLTPTKFYNEYVDYNVNDYVCLINDPRKEHPYNKIYSVK